MFVCVSVFTVVAAAQEKAPLVVLTPDGPVRGFQANGTRWWRGIPYATPPLGALRFRPPTPPAPWTAVRDATKFGPVCIQMGAPSLNPHWDAAWETLNLEDSSEDCLTLNVYAPPSASTGALLPVMVYLHAGEFRFGASNDDESLLPFGNGAPHSVVLVTLNVRLGIMGFAAHDALRSRDATNSTGNYGMQDQRAALRWVQRSIHAFGGDAAQVTLFGESSGGTSVAFHVLSARSAGLFKRAIMESPGLTQTKPWAHAVANTEYVASAVAATEGAVGCAWPAGGGAPQEWLALSGMAAVKGHPLGTFNSTDAAKKMCETAPDCFLVYACGAMCDPDKNWSAAVYGGAPAGTLSNSSVRPLIANLAMRTPPGGWPAPGAPSISLRLVDRPALVQCLEDAPAADLIAIMMSPPYSDTFQTDAAAPAIDGVELTDTIAAMSRNASNIPAGVDLLGGANLDEGTEFMSSESQWHTDARRCECRSAPEYRGAPRPRRRAPPSVTSHMPPLRVATRPPRLPLFCFNCFVSIVLFQLFCFNCFVRARVRARVRAMRRLVDVRILPAVAGDYCTSTTALIELRGAHSLLTPLPLRVSRRWINTGTPP